MIAVLILTHLAVLIIGLAVKASACYLHGVDSGRRLTEQEHHYLRPAEPPRQRRRQRLRDRRGDPLVYRPAASPARYR